MKVLHVIDALGVGGGAEHSLAAILPRLRERGVDSSIVCLIPREGGLQARLREEGFDVTVLPSRSWPGQVAALRRRLRTSKPAVVHATLFNSCLVTRLAAIGLDVRQVNSLVNVSYDPVRIRESTVAPWKLATVRSLDGFTARLLGDHFHAVTQAVRDEAVNVLGIDARRVAVIPRGRSVETLGEPGAERRARVRSRLGLPNDVPVLLNVGRQDFQKAQDHLIRAFSLLLEKHPSAVLLVAGREGSGTSRIQAALNETGVGASVRLLGHRTDVADLYAAADLFVFPSLYEGIGGGLLEAMALGTPIVGSDAAGVAEVLDHGRYGIVVKRGDVEALAAAMHSMLTDPERHAEYARRGRARFVERYDLGKVADAMVSMYSQLASESGLATA